MIAYLAKLNALSCIATFEGKFLSLSIFITALHLANLAPAAYYLLHLSFKPSIPCVAVSSSCSSILTTPLSTLIPGIIPASLN